MKIQEALNRRAAKSALKSAFVLVLLTLSLVSGVARAASEEEEAV